MLSENLVKAFNAQINAEMWSSNLYLSMSVYFAQNGYDGMASWMRAQSKEELDRIEGQFNLANQFLFKAGSP